MGRIACPECEQTLNVPDGARAVRCPACTARIDIPATPPPPPARPRSHDDEADRPRARRPRGHEDDEQPRRRGKSPARGKGAPRGIVAFVLFGPACLVLMAWAPFSGYGTALGMLTGALAMLVAIFGIVSRYFHDPVLTERIGDPNGWDAHTRMIVDCVPAAFAHPRRIGLWVAVEALGFLLLVEAMCTAAFLKTMDERPGANAPGQPAGPGPNQPPAPPAPTNDEVIAKALAGLGSKEPGVEWKALDDLGKVPPNPRRAEVLQKVVPLLDESRDGITRTRAVRVIGVWGGPDEVPVLAAIIEKRDTGIREEAVRAVTRFRDPRAIPALMTAMNDYDSAQKALIEIGPAVEPHLTPYLGVQADFQKQGPALKVLKNVGTAASVSYLQALVRLDDGVRSRAAREALDAIAARARKEPTPP